MDRATKAQLNASAPTYLNHTLLMIHLWLKNRCGVKSMERERERMGQREQEREKERGAERARKREKERGAERA